MSCFFERCILTNLNWYKTRYCNIAYPTKHSTEDFFSIISLSMISFSDSFCNKHSRLSGCHSDIILTPIYCNWFDDFKGHNQDWKCLSKNTNYQNRRISHSKCEFFWKYSRMCHPSICKPHSLSLTQAQGILTNRLLHCW